MKKILVVGATGMLGMPVAQKLKEKFEVRLLVRSLSKAKHQLGEDFEYIVGDVFNPESLDVACHGVAGVHINLSGEREVEGVKAIVDAAKANDLRRITFISGSNVSEETIWFPFEKRKYDAERAIMDSRINYTIFRPTWFMESLPLFVRGKRATTFGDNPALFHFVAAEDYANMVSVAYLRREARDRIFYIYGPESFRFKDALEQYVHVVHPEIKSVSVVPYFVGALIGLVTGKKMLRDVVQLMKFFEKVGELGDPTAAQRVLGTPKITLEKWIQQMKARRLRGSTTITMPSKPSVVQPTY